jgi:hypothetical protein
VFIIALWKGEITVSEVGNHGWGRHLLGSRVSTEDVPMGKRDYRSKEEAMFHH